MSAVITSMRTFEMQSCEDDADSYVRDVWYPEATPSSREDGFRDSVRHVCPLRARAKS